MAYVVPIHRPSSIRHALRIKLFSGDEECLAVSKVNRIEIWRFSENDELALFHSQRVYGTISMLDVLRPKDSDTEVLFVGTDCFEYFTVSWDPALQSLQTVDSFHDVGEKHLRDSQSQDRCVVDPSGRYMALLLWEGVLCVLRMKARRDKSRSSLDWMDQVRLSELFIKACTFLHSETGHPKIAFLYQSQSDRRDTKLSSYRLTSDDGNSVASRFDPNRDREINEDLRDIGSAMLIPVETNESERRHNVRKSNAATAAEPHLGGLLVVGETRLIYYDGITHAKIEKVPTSPTVYVAWARFDSTHYFLADDQGVLRLLTLLTNGPVVDKLEVHAIGKTTRASSLVYYEEKQLLFVGAHFGDSQLYRINLDGESSLGGTDGAEEKADAALPRGEHGSVFCELLQVFPNVGPILDFVVVDMGNRDGEKQLANEYASGQARIVTGSGAHKDGSLRSIRSGVGLEDAGILGDFDNARSLFSLRLNPATPSNKVDTLVVSFLTETRVFAFDSEGNIEEKDSLLGDGLDVQSLWVSNVDKGSQNMLLRVTPQDVSLVDTGNSGLMIAMWRPPYGKVIVSASANNRWVLLSIDGTLLVSLSLDKDLAVAAEKDFGTEQIASIHAAPQLLDTGIVSMWTAGTVTIVDLGTLQPAGTSVLFRAKHDTTSVARSIALVQMMPTRLSGPTLFVALDEGTVVMFSYSVKDSTLSARKSTVLGVHHANLHLLPQADGTYSIFATANHPSLIYGSEGRIVCAAVTAQDTTVVCPFDSEAFPDAIVLGSLSEIKLAHADVMRRTHVQTIPMRESVRRVAYSPVEKVYALGCIAVEIVRGVEVANCSIKLVDDILFQQVGKPLQLEAEKGELVESLIRAELRDSQGNLAERFLLGTSYVRDAQAPDTDDNDTMGRLLIVGIDSERNPYLISAHRMRGPCRCLATLGENIVLGLSKTVIIAEYIETTSMSSKLRKIASIRASTFVVDISVDGNYIAIGDMMKSTSVVEYIPATAGDEGEDEEEEEEDEKPNKGKGRSSRYVELDSSKKKKTKATPAQLAPLARYYQASWVTSIASLGSGGDGDENTRTWLEADGYGNLSVLSYNANGVTAEDRRRLRSTSEMNLGEQVNQIRTIEVEATNPHAMVHPKAFLATTEGSVYLFGTVAANAQDLLMRLQAKLETTVKGLGMTSFSSYRGFRNQEREAAEPNRFLDGEMLERFLDLDEEMQKEVAQGLGPSVEDLRNSIEELKRLH